MNWKKTIFIVGFLGVSFGLGFLMYFLFIKPPSLPIENVNVTPYGELPGVSPGFNANLAFPPSYLPGLENRNVGFENINAQVFPQKEPDDIALGSKTLVLPINEDRVENVEISQDGHGFVFYDLKDGKFYRLSSDGQNKILLTDETFFKVEKVFWAPNKSKALIEYPDGANIFYDFTKRKSYTLPKEIEEPDFTLSSEKIAYKYITSDPDSNFLAVSNPDGSGAYALEPIGEEGSKVQVAWSPNLKVVALYRKPIGINREEIFFIGLHGENFKSLIVDGSNFKGMWSPQGDRILYHIISSENDFNPTLWIVDAEGENIGLNKFNLGLSTFVDKCTFSHLGDILYCAVPKSLEIGSGLYPEIVEDMGDLFYKIDLKTGLKKLIALPVLEEGEINFNVEKIFLSKDESYLFFFDKISKKIYKMKLLNSSTISP